MNLSLPDKLPLLCLSGVILLPRVRLPLNIFEPRFINMIGTALGQERLVGLVQPMDDHETQKHPPLFKIGCVGKIVTFAETDDDRFLINLMGISRFRIKEETMSGPLRTAQVSYEDYEGDLNTLEGTDVERARLISLLKNYFEIHSIQADWSIIESSGDEELISSLCLSCPFESSEKQALLEAPTFLARAQTLIALLEMACLRLDNGDRAKH